jgi:Zn-dependent protease with chaperone function
MKDYRFPTETLTFWMTILLVGLVVLFTSAATFCLSGLFIIVMFIIAYIQNKAHHQSLMQEAIPVNQQSEPELYALLLECNKRLNPGRFECFIAPNRSLNAYTFGIEDPKTIVLYSSLFKIMDRDELAFIIGHEMGHIQLDHTWLNTILGGMAGVPTSYGAAITLTLAFRVWNRICEYSADRAGLLVCRDPNKAISALLKLVSGDRNLTDSEIQQWLQIVDREDDSIAGHLNEMLQDHPLIIKRIQNIKEFAKSDYFKRRAVSG